jgi:hypothetical protein
LDILVCLYKEVGLGADTLDSPFGWGLYGRYATSDSRDDSLVGWGTCEFQSGLERFLGGRTVTEVLKGEGFVKIEINKSLGDYLVKVGWSELADIPGALLQQGHAVYLLETYIEPWVKFRYFTC